MLSRCVVLAHVDLLIFSVCLPGYAGLWSKQRSATIQRRAWSHHRELCCKPFCSAIGLCYRRDLLKTSRETVDEEGAQAHIYEYLAKK